MPGAQPWMLGVANVRGSLLPVVDLKQFLEGERTLVHEGQRVLVVRQSGGNVAVIIDELYGQQTVELDRAKREAILHKIQQLMVERTIYAPIWQLAFLNGTGPRVGESGFAQIPLFPYTAPYEDITIKG